MSDIFQVPAWKISGIFPATECPNFLPHGTPPRIYSHSPLPTGARRSDRRSDHREQVTASDRPSDRKWPPKWPLEPGDRKWPPQWPPRVSDRKWPPKWPQVTARGKWPQVAAEVTASDRREQVTASDRKWPIFQKINFYCICTLSELFWQFCQQLRSSRPFRCAGRTFTPHDAIVALNPEFGQTIWLRVVALLWHDVTVGWYGRPAFGQRPIYTSSGMFQFGE